MIIDTTSWGWPQWVQIALWGVVLMLAAFTHGSPKTGKHSFPATFVGLLISMFVLVAGGFFK